MPGGVGGARSGILTAPIPIGAACVRRIAQTDFWLRPSPKVSRRAAATDFSRLLPAGSAEGVEQGQPAQADLSCRHRGTQGAIGLAVVAAVAETEFAEIVMEVDESMIEFSAR